MNDCLFLPANCGAELSTAPALYWQPANSPGLALSWAACANELAGRSLALVLPMEVVSACAVQLPTQKARWLRQALPYAVEDLLAEDVEQLHLALGEPLADGRHTASMRRPSANKRSFASPTAARSSSIPTPGCGCGSPRPSVIFCWSEARPSSSSLMTLTAPSGSRPAIRW